MLAEQHRFGLLCIDDERHDDVALRAELGGRRARDAAFGRERVQHRLAHVACVHAKPGAQQRAGDAQAHRTEANDSNIS